MVAAHSLPASPLSLGSAQSDPNRPEASAAIGSLPIAYVRSMSPDFFPGRLAAVVFLRSEPGAGSSRYSWTAVEYFLSRWSGRLESVAFSGDAPEALSELGGALLRCRELGFGTALHTRSGSTRDLKPLLPGLDWLSLEITPAMCGRAATQICLQQVMESGIAFECRTSLRAAEPDLAWLRREADRLARGGVRRFALQVENPSRFLSEHALLCQELTAAFPRFEVRALH